QGSHVPRFGSWDKDNVPYTEYFDNARREKGGVKINPNDPQENPEAFGYGMESDADFSIHHRTASVPKFGAWDETDPKSGDGFTVIFDRVKQEKQIASTTLPTPTTHPINIVVSERNQGSSSPKLKESEHFDHHIHRTLPELPIYELKNKLLIKTGTYLDLAA
ncbi:hypothetical protein Tsubulata_033949, partial [Turnera subulata]